MKNYTLEGLTNFDNKDWYSNINAGNFTITTTVNDINGNETSQRIFFTLVTQSLKDYELFTYNEEIVFDEVLTKFIDDKVYVRYYIKHYNENYYTLCYTKLDKVFYEMIKYTLQNLIKNQAWQCYAEILVDEKIIHDYSSKYALRTDFEKIIQEWVNDANYNIWEEDEGVFEGKFECFEPEIKKLQNDIDENYEKTLKADEEILQIKIETSDAVYRENLKRLDIKNKIEEIKNAINNNECIILNGDIIKSNFYCISVFEVIKEGDINKLNKVNIGEL